MLQNTLEISNLNPSNFTSPAASAKLKETSPDAQLAGPQEVTLFTLKDKPVLTKTIKGGYVTYKYSGPKNKDIQDYLDDLFNREGAIKSTGYFHRLLAWNKRVDKFFQKYFPWSCIDGPLAINKDSLLLFFVMLTAAIVYATQIETTPGNSNDEALDVIRTYGALYVFIFTFYGIVFLSLPLWWAFIVFVLQIMIPVFLILFDLNLIFPRDNVPDVNTRTLVARILAAVLPAFWGIIYPPFKIIRYQVGRFTAHAFVAVIFVGICICAIGIPLLTLLKNQEAVTFDFLKDNTISMIMVSVIFISISWLVIHFKFFRVPTPILERTLMELAKKTSRKLRIVTSETKPISQFDMNFIPVPTFKDRIMANMYWISSLIVGSVYIGIEMYLLSGIIDAIKASNSDGVVCSLFFFAGVPIFLLVGLPIAMGKVRAKNKALFLPIIFIVPMFGVIPLADKLAEYESGANLKWFLIVGPPGMIFFWLGMAFLGLKKRRLFYVILTFSCVFFFLPFIFLGLSQSSFFDDISGGFFVGFITLMAIFAVVSIVLLFWKVIVLLLKFVRTKVEEAKLKNSRIQQEKERLRVLREYKARKRREKKEQEGKAKSQIEDMDDEDDIELEELDYSLAHLEELDGPSSGSLSKLARNKKSGKDVTSMENLTLRKKKDSESRAQLGSNKDVEDKRGGIKSIMVEDAKEGEGSKGLFSRLRSKKSKPKSDQESGKMNIDLLRKMEIKKKLQLLALMYTNMKNFGYWVNAVSFIISYTFIAYTYFNKDDTATETEKGILLGVTIVMPIIFISNNLLIRFKNAKMTSDERKVYTKKTELERVFYEDRLKLDEERLKKATLAETYVLMSGILLIPLLQIPMFFVFSSRKGRIANLFIMIISIFFSMFIGATIEVKKRSGPYHKFFVPSFVSLCWLIILLPFIVVIPLVSTVLQNDSNDFKIFVKASLISSAFLLMFGVTLFAIIVNVIFQKIEKEKLIKFLIKSIQKVLKENSVKADDVVVRRLIEEYLKKDTEIALDELRRSLVHDRIPIVPIYPPKFKVTPYFSAGLILIETYHKILKQYEQRKKMLEDGEKKPKKESSCLKKLAQCCQEDDHMDSDEDFEDQIKEIGIGFDDSYFKADHYLPRDFDENIWNYALGNYDKTNVIQLTENDEEYSNLFIEELDNQPSDYDPGLRDHMTPVLEALIVRPLSEGEIRQISTTEHAITLQNNMTQAEIWYQHVYDYFSGKATPYDENAKSPGMVYQNYLQFLRITGLIQEEDLPQTAVDSIYGKNAKKKAQKGSCLAYNGFVQALIDIATKILPDTDDDKLLRRFTKKIYPTIMLRIPEILRAYSALTTFTKARSPYVPHLELFEKRGSTVKLDILSNPSKSRNSLMPSNQDSVLLAVPSQREMGRERASLKRRPTNILQQVHDEAGRSSVSMRKGSVSPKDYEFASDSVNTPNVSTNKPRKSQYNPAFADKLVENANYHKKKKEMKNRSASTKNLAKKLLFSCYACCFALAAKCSKCLTLSFVKTPKYLGDWVYKKTKFVGKSLGFAIDEDSDDEDQLVTIKKIAQEAPTWPLLVDKLFSVLPKAIAIYFQQHREKGITLQFNLTNVFAVVGKIVDIYTFISFAFRSEIPWFSSSSGSNIIQTLNGESSWFNSFVALFWLGVGLVFLYLALSIPAIYYLRKGKLGEDELGRKASFPHPQFFLTFSITILGGTLFTYIMRYLLYAYVCNYSKYPWTLMRDSNIECLTDEHSVYMGVGAIALLIYYPISTFIFPNFQFQNKVLDLKYDPSFTVIQIQARLLITGFISFFKPSSSSDTSALITQLVGTSTVLLLLAIASFVLKPCLIKKVNIWDVGGYSVSAWVNFCALLVVLLDQSVIPAILLGAGAIIIVGLTIYVIKKYYSTKDRKRKTNLDVGVVTYDPHKRKAQVPEQEMETINVQEILKNRRRKNTEEEEYRDDFYDNKKGPVF